VDFSGRSVLRDIGLTIHPGERLVLLGPNGAGKTTLLRAALGLVPLANGWVRLLGGDPHSPEGRISAMAGTGSSIEQPGLPPMVFTDQYLAWWAALYGLENPSERAKALLAAWSLPSGVRAEKLSQGQRQILQILRCLIHDPDLLVLDEPTSFLDPDSREAFEDGIRQWRTRTGGALLLSTHHLDEAFGTADRIVVLSQGRLRLEGRPEELLSAPGLTRLLRLDPDQDLSRISEFLGKDSQEISLRDTGVVRGSPAWRVSCATGEAGHGELLAKLAGSGCRVRSLDRDETTLREFWESALSAPARQAPFRDPPPAVMDARSRLGFWSAASATARFQIVLILRERRLVLPIVLLEAFFLATIALTVGPGLGDSATATILLLAGLLPLGLSSSLAADTFAGERERRSLETLLCAPISALPLFAGRGVASLLPGQILSWLGIASAWLLLARTGNVPKAGLSLVLAFLVAPCMGFLATAAALTASRRAHTVRSAAQAGALLLMPLLASAQFLPYVVAMLLPGHELAGWMGIAFVMLACSGILVLRAASGLTPSRLLSR